ncbi:MAG: global cell cycle regulator GcrA-like protein, partial [Magnetovibrio sp.]|nr:global cell cycle regulator GcrA-like protein [Magnetovibrio sp.]
MQTTYEWTPQRVNALIALWDEGLPTSEIGRRLGITKNAVIGKVHRLGLAKRGSPIKERPDQPQVSENLVTMAKLRPGMCSWPVGEPNEADFHFCGEESLDGKPYCREH